MTKRDLLARIIAQLAAELKQITNAALATHAEATDDENKAEDKYDTRGLEASYLARGQSRQAAETEQALAQFQALPCRPFAPAEPIDIGALVELKGPRDKAYYFVGPSMGGTEVMLDGHEITVITPQSPLGQQLVGHKTGDKVKLPSGQDRRIASVE